MSGAVPTFGGEAPTLGQRLFDSWIMSSPLNLMDREGRARQEAFAGAWAPAPDPDYNPYRDEDFRGYDDSFHLFERSRSRAESQFIRSWIDQMRERSARMEQGSWIEQFLAANVTPEGILLAPLGVGRLTAATRLGRAGQSGVRWAGLNAAINAGQWAVETEQLPGGLQQDLGMSVALGAVFGGALGAAGGALSRQELSRAAARHAAVHDAHDGLTTPGVEPPEPLRRWFGASQVVDGSGGPLRVYHGSGSDFAQFQPGASPTMQNYGLFFSPNPEHASIAAAVAGNRGGTPTVYPVFLRIERPFRTNDRRSTVHFTAEQVADLKARGHDGVIYNADNPALAEYVVFDPAQVKSATGNRGTFDPDSADIRFDAAPHGWGEVGQMDLPPDVTPAQFRELRAELARLVGPRTQLEVGDIESGARGVTFGPLIRLAMERTGETAGATLRHEAFHILRTMKKLTDEEWDILVRRSEAEGWAERYDIPNRYEDHYHGLGPEGRRNLLREEAIAEEFAHYRDRPHPDRLVERVFAAIREFLERVENAIRGAGFRSADDVLRAFDAGEFAGRRDRLMRGAGSARAASKILTREDSPFSRRFRTPEEMEAWLAHEAGIEAEIARLVNAAEVRHEGIGPDDDIFFQLFDAPPAPPAAAAGEAPDGRAVRFAGGAGAKLIRLAEMPLYRMINNRFEGAVGRAMARWAAEIVQIPGLRMEGEELGNASYREAVEAMTKQWSAHYVAASRQQDEAYWRYMGWRPEGAGPVRARLEDLAQAVGLSKPGRQGKLTIEEFDQRVGLAATGRVGADEIPEVLEAAKYWRERVFEPFAETGAEHGVILTHKHRALAERALRTEAEGRELRITAGAERLGLELSEVAAWRAARAKLSGLFDDLAEARDRYWASKDFAATDPETRAAFDAIDAAWQDLRTIWASGHDAAGGWGDPRYRAAYAIKRRELDDLRAALADTAEGTRKAELGRLREAYGALAKQLEARDLLDDQLNALAATDPNAAERVSDFRQMVAAQEVLDRRIGSLSELRPSNESYTPHVWIQSKVREGRDALAKTVARYWDSQNATSATGGPTWAPSLMRADIAISHLLGENAADATERAILRGLLLRGMAPEPARAKAAEAVSSLRAYLAENSHSKAQIEWASVWGRQLPPDMVQPKELRVRIGQALRTSGWTPNTKLVDELAASAAGTRRSNMMWGDQARPGAAKERTIDVPSNLIADYLDLGLRKNGADYLRRMGSAVEMSRKFGDASMLGRLEQSALDMMDEVDAGRGSLDEKRAVMQGARDLRDKQLGNFMVPEDPDAYSVRTVRALRNYATVLQLGSALQASITDLGRLQMEFGARELFSHARDAIARNPDAYRLGAQEAIDAGAASELVTLARHRAVNEVQEAGADALLVERIAEKGAEAMQLVNLVGPWTQKLQEFAGALHQSRMIEASVLLRDGRARASHRERLAQYGITPEQAARYADAWEAAGGGRMGQGYLASTADWADAADVRSFRAQLASAVQDTVMTPSAGSRPNFMSAPMNQMLLLYKGFAITATQRFLMAGMQRRDMQVAGGMLSSIAIAWLFAGPAEGPYDKHPILSPERLMNAIDRSGALGIIPDINNAIERVSANEIGVRAMLGLDPPTFAKDPSWAMRVGELTGPAIAPYLRAVWAFTSAEAEGDHVAGAIRRLLPFNNLIWINAMVGALQREAGTGIDALGPEPEGRSAAARLPGFMGGGR